MFSALSYNIRFVLDRHKERMPLVENIICGKEEMHDIACLQEVQNGGQYIGQDQMLQNNLPGKWETNTGPCFPSYLERIPFFGTIFAWLFTSIVGLAFRDAYAYFNLAFLETILSYLDAAFLFHTPILGDIVYFILGSGWSFGNLIIVKKDLKPKNFRPLLLGGKYRIAQRSLVHVKNVNSESGEERKRVWVVNVHLSDTPGFPSEKVRAACEDARVKEFKKIISWLDKDKKVLPTDGVLIMGDFNSPPEEHLHVIAQKNGFKSAFKEIHGEEPDHTFHQNHECATKDLGDEECYDYIFYRGPIKVESSKLVGTKPHASDPTLYPSDHFGISATFSFL